MHAFETLNIPEHHVGIHWFGQSSFAFKSAAGTIIHVDPYFPHERTPDRFIHPKPPIVEAELETHYVILTHDHGDHTCIESIERIHRAFPTCQYIGPPESMANLRKNGIPEDLLTEVTAGDSQQMVDVGAKVVWAKPPEGDADAGIKAPDVQHLGYVLTFGSVILWVSGDPINNFADHDEILTTISMHDPDIGIVTTHPSEGEFPFFPGAVETAFKLGLRVVIPAHYQCFTNRYFDPSEFVTSFPEDGPFPIVLPYNSAIVYPE